MKVLIILIIILTALFVIVWIGLQVRPKSFPAFEPGPVITETIQLPDGLPAPAYRFFQQIYGGQVPIIESAVISGRVTMRINGITVPGRFRFTHLAGQGYRHYIEATLFGLPVLKINEYYLDGHGRMEMPFGILEGEHIDQAANLGLWAESMWLPAILITDRRTRWEPVDDKTAILIIPDGEDEERFVVRFDPTKGLLTYMEAMRYRDTEDEGKILWLTEAKEWGEIDGHLLPWVGGVTWIDQGTPWAIFMVEEVVYNAAITEYIRAAGP